MVNDVSGGLADRAMADVVRGADCHWVIMHWRGHSRTMQQHTDYDDVVADVCDELRMRVDDAVMRGVPEARLILDPGIGFAKTAEQSWSLTAQLDTIVAMGMPVLFGASRKSFLSTVLSPDGGPARPAPERDAATVATTIHALAAGAWGVRVHDVASTVDAIRVVEAMHRYRAAPCDPAEEK
jgi:dihydropteroate synthase